LNQERRSTAPKTEKKDIITQVTQLARLGNNDSEIGRILDIHRITVKRYRELGEKKAVGTEARIRVVQEALSRHFDDLVKVCERLQSCILGERLEKVIIRDLTKSREEKLTLAGGRGNEVQAIFKVGDGKAVLDRLSIEDDLQSVSLKQHTKNHEYWPLLSRWKEESGSFVTNMSGFYGLIERQATEETGFKIISGDESPGLTADFVFTIVSDVWAHAFHGAEGLEGTDYSTNPSTAGRYDLRVAGYVIATSDDRQALAESQHVHRRLMHHYRSKRSHANSLEAAIKCIKNIKSLEPVMFVSLQKLILKRTFEGRCELCPD